MATVNDFQIYRGEDVTVTVTISGTNITGWNLKFYILQTTISKTVGSGITITDGVGGVFTITLARADTLTLLSDKYAYDIWREDIGAYRKLGHGSITVK